MNDVINKINENNIEKCLSLLNTHFNNQNTQNMANVEFPNSIIYGTNEWLIYMFYSCLLDYGMRSKIYHQYLINTFYKYPKIFMPKYVVEHYKYNESLLLAIIKNNIHPRYPNIALKKWITLSSHLAQYDNLLKEIKKLTSFIELEIFIKSIKGYGQKTGGLLLRLISEAQICDFNDAISSIPLDRHDIEISYLNSIIESKKLSQKQIRDLSNSFISVGNKLGMTPSFIDKCLWEIGNKFCNNKDCLNCPLKKNCKSKKYL